MMLDSMADNISDRKSMSALLWPVGQIIEIYVCVREYRSGPIISRPARILISAGQKNTITTKLLSNEYIYSAFTVMQAWQL